MDTCKKNIIGKTISHAENASAVTGIHNNVLNKNILRKENIPAPDPGGVVLSPSQRRRLRKKKSLQKKHLISSETAENNKAVSETCSVDVTLPPKTAEFNYSHRLPGDIIQVEYTKNNKIPPGKLEICLLNVDKQTNLKTHALDTVPITIPKKQDQQELSKYCKETAAMAQKLNKDRNKSNPVSNVTSKDETDFVSGIKIDKGSSVKAFVESDKSRDQIKAEREAKKLAKQLTKTKVKTELGELPDKNPQSLVDKSKVSPIKENIPTTEHKHPVKVVTAQVAAIHIENVDQKQEKSKSELKAERRAIQEAQRTAKEQGTAPRKNAASIQKKKPDTGAATPKPLPAISKGKNMRIMKKNEPKLVPSQHKVKLFNHLYPEREATSAVPFIPLNSGDIHPAIIRLGVQYASRIVMGSNARCIALLNALKQVIEDYTLPANVEFSRGFEAHLSSCLTFLNSCRPPAVSMNNALKHIKWQLTQLPNSIEENDAKSKLQVAIDTYIDDQIRKAGEAITIAVNNKISNGDVILTYGCSSLVENILKTAAKTKCFKVVVIEAHPWNEGKEMLRRLTAKNIKCSLVMISALSFVMREINKVVLGAGALLANGYVMARAGTAQVAMVAHAYNVPVLVCCEIHKFSERVQTDSFVYNEIGDPDDLVKSDPLHQESPLSNWRNFKNLTPLNLTYDVTPPDLVTAVVTELAILPCTSVPVILRIKPSEF